MSPDFAGMVRLLPSFARRGVGVGHARDFFWSPSPQSDNDVPGRSAARLGIEHQREQCRVGTAVGAHHWTKQKATQAWRDKKHFHADGGQKKPAHPTKFWFELFSANICVSMNRQNSHLAGKVAKNQQMKLDTVSCHLDSCHK